MCITGNKAIAHLNMNTTPSGNWGGSISSYQQQVQSASTPVALPQQQHNVKGITNILFVLVTIAYSSLINFIL